MKTMYTLFERDETGIDIEFRDFRSLTPKEVFQIFAEPGEIVPMDFKNHAALFAQYCETCSLNGEVQEFHYRKILGMLPCKHCSAATVCNYREICEIYSLQVETEKKKGIILSVEDRAKRCSYRLFCRFGMGNKNMPIILYANSIYPAWYGFERESDIDYAYLLSQISEKIQVGDKIVPRFYLSPIEIDDFFYI